MADTEHDRQLGFIAAPPGEVGSGRVRYAAAMYLYQRHHITTETLEVFRVCAPDDRLDPLAELRRLGITRDMEFLQETIAS
jgi:hypothetical protein